MRGGVYVYERVSRNAESLRVCTIRCIGGCIIVYERGVVL